MKIDSYESTFKHENKNINIYQLIYLYVYVYMRRNTYNTYQDPIFFKVLEHGRITQKMKLYNNRIHIYIYIWIHIPCLDIQIHTYIHKFI